MYLRVCKCCNKEFETNLYSKTYCSYVCKNKFKNEKRKRKRKRSIRMSNKLSKEFKELSLKQKQSLPLESKIILTKKRLREWYEYWEGDVYISFSGGKDSTVLLDIARQMYPNIEAVFCDTGLEYPENKKFVKTKENVNIIKPKVNFKDVISKYGYPIISKEQSHYISKVRNTKSEVIRNKHVNGINRDGSKSQFVISKNGDIC